ncbi:aminopeptidase [Embleya scabrispora]|uniref:Aminopeptidase n=1 Tax=Embleya scabrispora TaxID=159449 RepID=A0A1T3NKD6_9ACTN|nr:alpha/beta hydrolase [Embleya scabrispora]OPC77175.1 aminopeptidase [Embleya scabrispora]
MLKRSGTMLCAAVVLALASTLVSAVPAGAAMSVPAPVWGDCPPSAFGPADPRLRCTTVQVPLDYRAPSGRRIDIAVSRLSTAKPGLRRGVLVHNGGGPGVPSLHLPELWSNYYPREVLDRYDLVGFDPRGLGRSTPITCGRTADRVPHERVIPFPGPDGAITANVRFARELARDCLANGGEVLRHVTTANTARDLDRIRIALGERKISYRSASYGSYLGAVYSELFPERTDRIVLDASSDPNSTWHERWADWDRGFDVRFGDFASWAAERAAVLGLGDDPAAVRANYLELAERLDRSPVTHPVAGPVDGAFFRSVWQLNAYHTLQFPEFAAWFRFLRQGGPAPRWAPPPTTPGVPEDNEVAVLLAVTCGDTRVPRDVARYRREVTASRARFPILGGAGANIQPCAFWPDPVGKAVRVTDRGPANILLLQTLRDPATPYAGALGMRRALGDRARMITVDGGNHGGYDPEAPSCALREADRFLATGTRPSRDLFCRPDPPTASSPTAHDPRRLERL